jgi:hypothetical protein
LKVYTCTIDKAVRFQYLESDGDRSNSNTELPSRRAHWCIRLTTEDGSLLRKAVLPRELEICQKLLYDPVLEALRPFIAKFLGTLKLEGEVDQSNPITANGGIGIKPIDDHKDECFPGNRLLYRC